jgi:hypothetical protein
MPEVSGDRLAMVRTQSFDSAMMRTSFCRISRERAFGAKAAAAYQKPSRSV